MVAIGMRPALMGLVRHVILLTVSVPAPTPRPPGGGLLADRLGRYGRRWWVTGVATCLAAPFLAISCLAPSPQLSYAAVLVGFALSEMWRAPSAVMARWAGTRGRGGTGEEGRESRRRARCRRVRSYWFRSGGSVRPASMVHGAVGLRSSRSAHSRLG